MQMMFLKQARKEYTTETETSSSSPCVRVLSMFSFLLALFGPKKKTERNQDGR